MGQSLGLELPSNTLSEIAVHRASRGIYERLRRGMSPAAWTSKDRHPGKWEFAIFADGTIEYGLAADRKARGHAGLNSAAPFVLAVPLLSVSYLDAREIRKVIEARLPVSSQVAR